MGQFQDKPLREISRGTLEKFPKELLEYVASHFARNLEEIPGESSGISPGEILKNLWMYLRTN